MAVIKDGDRIINGYGELVKDHEVRLEAHSLRKEGRACTYRKAVGRERIRVQFPTLSTDTKPKLCVRFSVR